VVLYDCCVDIECNLNYCKGGKPMASNFQISSFKTNGNLHLKLYGDFDVNSAQELTVTLLTHGASCWDIFIDTNNLETIHPFGRNTFKMNLGNFKKQLNNLFFIGANKHKIAPN
jgi:hypothetical protein